LSKSKTPEPLYRQFTPEEDRGKTRVSKYYRVNQNMDGLGTGLHPYNIECNLRIDFGLDGGIYKVEWSNKVLSERKINDKQNTGRKKRDSSKVTRNEEGEQTKD